MICSVLLLAGCVQVKEFTPTPIFLPTSTATPQPTERPSTCADLDAAWTAADWQAALDVIAALQAAKQTCGIEALASKRYAVLINYATQLESENKTQDAIARYREALALDGQRQDALRALVRLNALPPPTTAPCAPQPLTPYAGNGQDKSFARLDGNQIVVNQKPYYVRGINYYPRNAPWQGFLVGSTPTEIQRELDLIAARGFNTLRIFLWYDALFQCEPERAVPIPSAFAKLDEFIQLARERDLRLIVTLNDLPDFYFRPIYSDWARYDAQTEYIVRRYRDESSILMWDVRNEGDIDYGANGNAMPNTTHEQVLKWLAHDTALVRAADSNHLLTAGWLQEPLETAPYVDVLSLHHWSSAAGLGARIQNVRAQTSKPLLVEEMGLAGMGRDGEAAQAEQLLEMIQTTEQSTSAGWLIWTAFDFFALPDSMASPEYRFGIWRNDLSPKPVIDGLPMATRVP